MSQEKVVIRFLSGYARSGGPGWNTGETAAFDPEEADYIINTLQCGVAVEVRPLPRKAPDEPDQNKMVGQAPRKKSREKLNVE